MFLLKPIKLSKGQEKENEIRKTKFVQQEAKVLRELHLE